MRSVSPSGSPPSSSAQPTASSSAASKLSKQWASLIWRCCPKRASLGTLHHVAVVGFLLLRSSEANTYQPIPYATDQGTFHVDASTFLVEQAKFRSCVSAFTRVAPQQLASGTNSYRRAQICRGQRPFGEKA
jgi:hypothetical protein